MPKELTHWILADRSLDALDTASPLRAAILGHHEAYLGGAVLPDTLMHLLHGPHSEVARELAHRFHDTAGCSFAPLAAVGQRFTGGLPQPLLACLLGVISHMQADIVFHPFVYGLAGTMDIGHHYRIETEIDCHLLHQGRLPAVRRLSELLTPAVHDTLAGACALLFDPEGLLPRPVIDRALRLHCRFQGMYDRTYWKLTVRLAASLAGGALSRQRHLFYPLDISRETRFAEGNAVEWRHPVSRESRRTSVEELADETVRRTRETFRRIESAGNLAMALSGQQGENLLTGIHGACLSAMDDKGAD